MSVFKCKMCGGDIEFTPGATYGTCEYCGSKQTLPRLDDDRRANLYDRANHFRRNNEFDKAMGIYEQILNEDTTDAEAYWSLVLCRYGIEYVEDPATRRRVPTVNRAQFTSVFDDDNYKSALRYADTVQRGLYEEEANAINEIQKGILAISQKEEPFDVFICYKETDRNGRRTPDSVLANDLYHQLTQEGFKVFFSRITLEDKLGTAYEPYIFAALNSAKVMVVLGTRPEYFTAVWVKNEWSRYLALIKQGQKKMLIPAYKDMDPYDLPDEFSHLQAQDMSKLGFMQDLIRGIKKITQADTPKSTVIQEKVVVSGGEGNGKIASLLDRGNMALEDGDWEKAMGFFEEVLNNDSKNAQAYLGEALVQEKCPSLEALIQKRKALSQNVNGETLSLKPAKAHIDKMVQQYYIPNYVSGSALRDLYQYGLTYHSNVAERQQQVEREQAYWANHRLLTRAEKFAEGELKEELNSQKQALFAALQERLNKAKEEEVKLITTLQAAYARHIQSADQKAHAFYEQGANRQESDYLRLRDVAKTSPEPGTLFGTAAKLRELKGYKDSAALADYCETHAKEIQAQQKAEAERLRLAAEKKKKRIAIISAAAVAMAVAIFFLVTQVIIPAVNYSKAESLRAEGRYEEAAAAFTELGEYRDAETQVYATYYAQGEVFRSAEKWNDAITAFMKADTYSDAKTQVSKTYYIEGEHKRSELDWDGAVIAFESAGSYDDAATQVKETKYQQAKSWMEEKSYEEAISVFNTLNGYKDSTDMITTCETAIKDTEYNSAVALMNAGSYEQAIATFTPISNYKDSKTHINTCETAIKEEKYNAAVAFVNAGNLEKAITYFEEIKSYKDAKTQSHDCMLTLAKEYDSEGDTRNAVKWYEKAGDKDSSNKLMYSYVSNNKNNTNVTTYEYLKTLKTRGYKNAENLYSSLYALKAKVFFNESENDTSTSKTTINSRDSSGFHDAYCHYKVTGGTPGAEIKVRIVWESRWGVDNKVREPYKVKYDEEMIVDPDKDYTLPYRGFHLASNLYYHRITLYNAETREQLAQTVLQSHYYH